MTRKKKARIVGRPKGAPYVYYLKDTGIWEIRGTHPFTGQRFSESLGPGGSEEIALARRLEIENQWQDERLYGSGAVKTFGDALAHYLENKDGGSMRRYLPAILERFGHTRVSDLTTKMIKDWANEKWPNCSGVTKNTLSFNPMIAVLRFAAMDQVCDLPHFHKFEGQSKRVGAAPEEWIIEFLTRARRVKLRALVLLLTTTGARCKEARKILWEDVDCRRQEVLFRTTKNGSPRLVPIGADLAGMLRELRETSYEVGPFPYNRTDTVNKEIQRECERLGMESYPTHRIGRHAFAERLLRGGATMNELKAAGGWKCIRVCEERYGHLERGRIDQIIRGGADNVATALSDRERGR